jgi:peptidyl-dipeptidase Dcp
MNNPLLQKFETPFEVPPFDKIKVGDYAPAYAEAEKLHNEEIDKIINNTETPTFGNTIEAFDGSGMQLEYIDGIFNNVLGADGDSAMQAAAEKILPEVGKHRDEIWMNQKLFAKVKTVYEQKDKLNLNPEQLTLLTKTYKKFARGGADLKPEAQQKLKDINTKLSQLYLLFGKNLNEEKKNYRCVVYKKEDLAGLPDGIIAAAATTAKEDKLEGKWVFTLDKPSFIPVLQFSENRALREKLFKAYASWGNHDDATDNKKVINSIVNLCLEKAQLFGFKTYADFVLDDRMAKNSQNVYNLLDKVWTPALAAGKTDEAEFQKIIDKEGGKFKLEPWDWWFYADKVRKAKYDLNDEVLRPYFELNNCINGLFTVVNKLYGVTLTERKDLPKYNADVRSFEAKDAEGKTLGIIYMDFFPRATKASGAWMTEFRREHFENGKRILPVISTVFNFTKPNGDTPALLTFEEVQTLFHEFGHTLHGLLSQVHYYSIAGTSVSQDFVELPSQILENWAAEPEVLKIYAKNYKTGEIIPMKYIEKMEESSKFNSGFNALEYLAASYLDMSWNTITDKKEYDVNAFEKNEMDKLGLIPQIIPRYRSTYFQHVFKGEYAVGYYSYVWAELLDADAFADFKEHGIFDPKTAAAFKKNVLEAGGSEDEMILYKRFRGCDPKIEPLLKRKGFLK